MLLPRIHGALLILHGRLNNIKKRSYREPKKSTVEKVYDRFERIKSATGNIKVSELRDEMQEVMQKYVGVFREADALKKGKELMISLYKSFCKLGLDDHSLIYNTELQDALELENLLLQGIATVASALNREESRGAHTRIDYPDRDDTMWSKHTLFTFHENNYKIEYREVTLKGESINFPYEKRVY